MLFGAICLVLVLCASYLLFPRTLLLSALTVQKPMAQSGAIVLMAGTYRERAPAVAMLYHYGYAPLVVLTNDGVFSRWSKKDQRNLYNVEWAEEELVTLGIPREKIVKLPYYGSSTIFDAIAVKHFLQKSGLKDIIIVTSDYHSRRAFWAFSHLLDVSNTEIYVYPIKSMGIGVKTLVSEYLKLVIYKLRYGLLGLVPDANEIELKGQRS